MGVRIKNVRGNTDRLSPGDEITSINGFAVKDQLDIIFNISGLESSVLGINRKDGTEIEVEIDYRYFESEGVELEEMEFKHCSSKCIFCFVDQMPPGLRETLYCKDDDYRLSFLYGNYVTLNDISEEDLQRIIEYNLSPLYVSVHAVDRKLREHIFGRPMKNDIIDILTLLSSENITMHLQVVLVPGMNDGRYLDETVKAVARLYPSCASLSIVPVGLTGYRETLPHIEGYTPTLAEEIFRWKEGMDQRLGLEVEEGGRFYYLSDEFYLLAGRDFPSSDYYGDFPQIDNGVGMSRKFIDNISRMAHRLKGSTYKRDSITVVTGSLGSRLIRKYIMPIIGKELPDMKIEIIKVENDLFGREVTVSGLLGGTDIIRSVETGSKMSGVVVIPPNAVNHKGELIDSMTVKDISNSLNRRVVVPEDNFLEQEVTG